jgi:outer membrane lipoprotein-sorting protein
MKQLGYLVRAAALSGAMGVATMAGAAGMRGVSESGNVHLDGVLRQMDGASAHFQNAQADLKKQVFTKVVNDTQEQSGQVYFLRKGGATQMGMVLTTQPQQVVEYKDGTVRVFNPGTNHVDTVTSSGANKARFETFLTLGFGGSGHDLAQAWMIDDQGGETMAGVATEKLDLVSKDPDVRKNVSHVTIWVDPARDVSLKQVLYFPNGDTQTATYSNIRLNGKVDMGAFAIKCKGKCE